MHKKIIVLGLTSIALFSGCQSIGDQLGKQIAKTVVEQGTGGAVNIDDLEKGKLKIKTEDGVIEMNGDENNGTFKVTGKDGKELMNANSKDGTFSIKNEKGEEVMKGDQNNMTIKGDDGTVTNFQSSDGTTKPSSVPSDLPTIDGGKGFSVMSSGDSVTVGYKVDGTDVKAICQKQAELNKAQGWQKDEKGLSIESEDGLMENYTKGSDVLLLACSKETDGASIALSKSKKKD